MRYERYYTDTLYTITDAGLPSSSSTSCYSCRTHLQTQQQPHARCSLRPCRFQGPSHVLRTHTDARPRTTSTCTAERSILPDGAGWNALLNSEWNDAAKEKDSTHRRDICYLDSPGIGGNFMFLVRRQFHAVLIRSGPNSLGDMMSMEIFENGRYPSQSHSHGRCRNSAKNIKNTERHGYMFDFGDHFGLCFDDSMVTRILLCQQYVKQITQDRTRWLKLIYSGGSTDNAFQYLFRRRKNYLHLDFSISTLPTLPCRYYGLLLYWYGFEIGTALINWLGPRGCNNKTNTDKRKTDVRGRHHG